MASFQACKANGVTCNRLSNDGTDEGAAGVTIRLGKDHRCEKCALRAGFAARRLFSVTPCLLVAPSAEYLAIRGYIFSAYHSCRDMVRFPACLQFFASIMPIEFLPATGIEMVVLQRLFFPYCLSP